jgi:hypothetical protein
MILIVRTDTIAALAVAVLQTDATPSPKPKLGAEGMCNGTAAWPNEAAWKKRNPPDEGGLRNSRENELG